MNYELRLRLWLGRSLLFAKFYFIQMVNSGKLVMVAYCLKSTDMHDTNKDGSTALLFHRHLLFLLIGIIEPNYGKMAPASRRKKCE